MSEKTPAVTIDTADGSLQASVAAGRHDEAFALLSAVDAIKATGGAVEIAGVRIETSINRGRTATMRAMEEQAAGDVEALARYLYDREGFHAADSWATETSINRGRYEALAEYVLTSDWLASHVADAREADRAEVVADMEGAWSIDPKISAAHFPEDGACPASGVPVESCDTCSVLTAYAEREQRWHWNLIREQNAIRSQKAAEAALAGLVAKIEALADGFEYDECEHDADHGCEPVEVYDYMGCSESQIGWGCSVCCYDDEYPREDCPHGADHRGITRERSCPTLARTAADTTALDAVKAEAKAEERERIAQAIARQASCGIEDRDHDGCYVADSLRIARDGGRMRGERA